MCLMSFRKRGEGGGGVGVGGKGFFVLLNHFSTNVNYWVIT